MSAQVSALRIERQQTADDVFNSGSTELEAGTEQFTGAENTADDRTESIFTVGKIDTEDTVPGQTALEFSEPNPVEKTKPCTQLTTTYHTTTNNTRNYKLNTNTNR